MSVVAFVTDQVARSSRPPAGARWGVGLALTALLASFMSGMAGNVTVFNTVWTYDLYQAYIAPKKTDEHYLWMGRATTVVGILLSIACVYSASNYSNAMDVVQFVFGFVNAPIFATFVLGMFWARATAHGAFFGLLGGTVTYGLFTGSDPMYQRSLGINVNVWWGAVLLLFGGLMLYFARKGSHPREH